MDLRGRRILLIGDSLSAATSAPGGVLAAELRARGAADVRIDARVGRSAVNAWTGTNGETGSTIAAAAARRPDIVIVMLGTNDAASGVSAAADEAGFRRIVATFAPGTEWWVIGAPAFPQRPDIEARVSTVYATQARVFGTARVLDARPLTPAGGRTSDGVHFTRAGGRAFGCALAAALAPEVVHATPAITGGGWRWTFAGAALAAVGVGVAFAIRRRRQLAGPRIDDPRDQLDYLRSRTREGEIDDAAERALAAGAQGPLEFMGAGAEGIVFCNDAVAYKVGRRYGRNDPSLATEAEFFRRASQVPQIKRKVARFHRYDAEHDVLVRECVRGRGLRRGGRHHVDEAEAFDAVKEIETAMLPYGYTGPERKGSSFVYVSGRGLVLVDGGFAHKVGHQLVKETLDKMSGRIPREKFDTDESLAWTIRQERGRTIPKPVADRLRARLGDKESLATPGVRVVDEQPWLDVGDDEVIKRWAVDDEDEIDGVELRSRANPNNFVLAHRTTNDGVRWQVTDFDERGPTGDSRRQTLVEALASRASPVDHEVVAVHTKAERGRGPRSGKLAGWADRYRSTPIDPDRGSPLDSWGAVNAWRVGKTWTRPVDVPLDDLRDVKTVVQTKNRLASIRAARTSGVELPPIEIGVFLDGSTWLIDGNHRLAEARKAGLTVLPVIFTFVERAS